MFSHFILNRWVWFDFLITLFVSITFFSTVGIYPIQSKISSQDHLQQHNLARNNLTLSSLQQTQLLHSDRQLLTESGPVFIAKSVERQTIIIPSMVPQIVKSMAIMDTFTENIDNLNFPTPLQQSANGSYRIYLPIIQTSERSTNPQTANPQPVPIEKGITESITQTIQITEVPKNTPQPIVTPELIKTATPTATPIPPIPPMGRAASYPAPTLLDNITRWIAPKPHPATYIPYPTPDGTNRTTQVPILMYHYLSVPPEDADIYRQDLSVSPGLFVEHLNLLWNEGYHTISLYELLNHLTIGAPLPEQSVVLTFDDGYRDNYEHAFPLLLRWNMSATFFIVSDFIDNQNPRYVTWDMVRTMYTAGMSIEAHSRNHASLKNSNVPFLGWQARELERIEQEIGVRPRFISYPAGEYDDLTISVFWNSNFWGGVTTQPGATHSNNKLFELRRVRVRGTTSAEDLKRLLEINW